MYDCVLNLVQFSGEEEVEEEEEEDKNKVHIIFSVGGVYKKEGPQCRRRRRSRSGYRIP